MRFLALVPKVYEFQHIPPDQRIPAPAGDVNLFLFNAGGVLRRPDGQRLAVIALLPGVAFKQIQHVRL